MKNITEILAGLEITIPEDKAEAFSKEFAANYKTIVDYEKQKESARLAKEQLDDVQGKLKTFEGVDVEKLKGEITKLSGDLQATQDNHAKELARRDRTHETEKFMTGYKWVNDETREFYLNKLESSLDDDANKGKSRKDILDALTSGEDGKPRPNIFATETQTPPPYAAGTGSNPMIGHKPLKEMSYVEELTFKSQYPDLYTQMKGK